MVRRDYSGGGLNLFSFSAILTLIITICPFAQSCGSIPHRAYLAHVDDQKARAEANNVDDKIAAYHNAAGTIDIGDPKSQVLARLPDQASLARYSKPREATIVDGKKMEIYYFRVARGSAGKTTDDEFIPHLFIDDTLHAIGWTAVRAFTNSR